MEGVRMKKLVGAAAVVAVLLSMATVAGAVAFTGTVAPTIFAGLADLNGSGTITAADSWTDFYGDTEIIGGGLDCDAWVTANDGVDGDGVIDADDDCLLVGFDGTADGVTITVSDGHFVERDGVAIPNGAKLPAVFNAGDPDNPSVVAADFAWQVLDGRVDANGNGLIDAGDCSVDIVNGWDILGPDCGFNPPTAVANAGLIDVDGNSIITAADDSPSGFFGHAVVDGFVQAVAPSAPTITSISPGSAAPGASVTITGTNLTGAQVTVCNVAAVETAVSATSVTFTVPTLAAGSCAVVVTTAGGTVSTTLQVLAGPTPPPGCTIIGTSGADTLTGTAGADTICAKSGADTVRAKQGDDVVKGAKGPDLLKGGKGNDLLRGGKGADRLIGGPGFDTCKGGKGPDSFINCEA